MKKILLLIAEHFSHNLRDNLRGFKRFNAPQKLYPQTPMLIFFVDGQDFHGGLCDRFKGIVSLFHYALCRNIPFKISYNFPFELSHYLLPNEYDWQISASDKVSFHRQEAKYINLIGDATAKRLLNLSIKRQIHVHANRDIVAELNVIYNTCYQWGELYKKLFKPTEELCNLIRDYTSMIGGVYIGVVFRFQNLLGDFTEYEYAALSEQEKYELIVQCKRSLCILQETSDCKKILVTSDSCLFLKSLAKMKDVYAFPKDVVHVDTVSGASHDVYMKSFLDFYLLSGSLKIYSVATSQMYPSEFPLYAAKLNNIPFERIII